MYCYIWSYVVRPESLDAFRIAYGPEGDWVRLFGRDPEYIRTGLLSDRGDPARFLTIDFWSSREAYLSFREHNSIEYDALDKSSADLTLEEAHLGDFDLADDA